MGLDIYVSLSLLMCTTTGKPFYFRTINGNLESSYEVPTVEVPSHLRKYLIGRGPLFTAYTEGLERDGMGFTVGADRFLESYPEWEDVKESSFYSDEPGAWSEEDHTGFKELLQWCVDQSFHFTVSWSY